MTCRADRPDSSNRLTSHPWTEYLYSTRGPVRGYRHCYACDRHETMFHDYTLNQDVWVEGDFASEKGGRIFIFAGSQGSFMEAMTTIQRELDHPIPCVWVQHDMDYNMIASYRDPSLYLAADWKESDVVDDPRFRLLFAVGHL